MVKRIGGDMGLRFCFVGVLLLVALPALAAIKPIVVDVYGHDSDNYLRVKLQPDIAADTLMGEPLLACRVKWSLVSAHIDGQSYRPNTFPSDVLNKLRLFSLRLIYQIELPAGFKAIDCDPGYLSQANNKQWSYTVPGSPVWQKLIRKDIQNTYTKSLQSQFNLKTSPRSPNYLSATEAKNLYQQAVMDASPLTGSWVRAVALEKGEVNMWPLIHHLKEQGLTAAKRNAEKKSKALKVVEADHIDELFSDEAFDAQISSASATASFQREVEVLSRAIEESRNQSAKKERQYQRQVAAYQQKSSQCQLSKSDNLKALLDKTRSCREAWAGLERFKKEGLYGYRLNGRVVIEPQYTEATEFNNGFALVRRDHQLFSISPAGDEQNHLGNVSLYHSSYSSGGLVLAQKGNKFGYINSKGKIIISFEYDDDGSGFDDQQRVIMSREYGGAVLYDEAGKELARSPIGFKREGELYISTESSRTEGHCEDTEVTGYKQAYAADGTAVGGRQRFSYGSPRLCLN
ncbi:WG repeat-containing protein [Spongiibacter sp. IMCC21906]|uniref:WG repeat-containing protein n=1 Tax=Spongiibacter sp. IMCC21906 TaxID=1620392 RepID=UPI0012E05189|nr:WG repeat-containing protein [Spongiibacter sp. IMCC21906]